MSIFAASSLQSHTIVFSPLDEALTRCQDTRFAECFRDVTLCRPLTVTLKVEVSVFSILLVRKLRRGD